jgi:hypothetical protein
VSKKEIVEHVNEQMQKDSTTNNASISAGGSILGVDLSASYSWENTKEIVDTVRTTVTSESDVTISETVKLERHCELTSPLHLCAIRSLLISSSLSDMQTT